MVGYLILGLTLLLAVALMAKWFVSTEPKIILKTLKWALFSVGLIVAVFFIVTGRLAWAFGALPAMLPVLLRARSLHRTFKNFSRMAGGGMGGTAKTTDVKTDYLSMTLDHDTGAMSGEILSGNYAGRHLHDLTRTEVLDLLETCLQKDSESARLIETYLDREHGGWRDQMHRTSNRANGSNQMDRTEALDVLGLHENASRQDIIDAHRRLISSLHPDHGGSSYLAAKINQAKDTLIK